MLKTTDRETKPLRVRRRSGARPRRAQMVVLKPGRVWKSFEQFRIGGQSDLSTIKVGEVGQLLTKTGSFRVLREDDFQHLYGLARDVERVQGDLRVIVAAARSAKRHQDEDTLQTLFEAVAVCENLSSLSIRPSENAVEPEGLFLDDDDLEGIIVEAANVPRPYATRNAEINKASK